CRDLYLMALTHNIMILFVISWVFYRALLSRFRSLILVLKLAVAVSLFVEFIIFLVTIIELLFLLWVSSARFRTGGRRVADIARDERVRVGSRFEQVLHDLGLSIGCSPIQVRKSLNVRLIHTFAVSN
ncbi:MAG TPA: hypothetical protein PKA76_17565, partial [Pirellulaceae bacterium]|nr:hypothetical protein [Pirellulaceae bacterium]